MQLAKEDKREQAPMAADPEGSVYFQPGGTQVDGSGKALLRRLAKRLKGNSSLVITLIGHTDALGSRSYNLAIAEERVDSVFLVLRSLGVPKGQIRRVNSGHSTVDFTCRSADCRRLMRRVELVFTQ